MLTSRLRGLLMGLAVTASLLGCSRPSNPPAISASNAAAAQSVGARLAAEDRANEERHRSELAKLMRLRIVHVEQYDRMMRIVLDVENLTPKTVKLIEFGLYDTAPDGKNIGTTELHEGRVIAPHARTKLVLNESYLRFGEDTGAVREALGKPQAFRAELKEIKYADGSDAGYDD